MILMLDNIIDFLQYFDSVSVCGLTRGGEGGYPPPDVFRTQRKKTFYTLCASFDLIP